MFLRHAVDVVAQVESEVGHVEHSLAAENVLHLLNFFSAQHAMNEIEWKLVMPRGHRRVGGKNTLASDRLDIVAVGLRPTGSLGRFVQQLEREQTGMSFVHVKALDFSVT